MSKLFLHKNRGSSVSSETSKYYVKCDATDTASRIEVVRLLQIQKDVNSRVLLAYLDNNQNKVNVVVKMGRENSTIKKEYYISEQLHKAECPGFIRFICIFECFDNNSPDKICQGTPENTKKEVIIMRYFNEGSVKSHSWNSSNFHILRSIIIQTVCSLLVAYHNTGFIHNDSHLDNILIKRTTKIHNIYQIGKRIIEIETNNYTCVIMDFENCFFSDKSSPIFFWKMMENIISRVGIELTNNKRDKVIVSNKYEILGYISKNENNDYKRVLNIIPMIEQMEMTILDVGNLRFPYDPSLP
jgi:serine/threonine protein kinase